MKTKNNVQKAILKTAAAIISLVLITFTVNAQQFWKTLLESDAVSHFAMALLPLDAENVRTTGYAVSINHETTLPAFPLIEPEEALAVENWMMNENNFAFSGALETEREPALALEGWMMEESVFEPASYSNRKDHAVQTDLIVEKEEPLQLENWMTDNRIWNK